MFESPAVILMFWNVGYLLGNQNLESNSLVFTVRDFLHIQVCRWNDNYSVENAQFILSGIICNIAYRRGMMLWLGPLLSK